MTFAHRLAAGALAALLAASVVVGAASSAAAAEATVTITSHGAAPRQVSGPPGLTVTIVNEDTDRHRLRARVPADADTGNIDPGASAGVILRVEGAYEFVDERTEDAADGFTVTITASASPPDAGEPDTGTTPGGGASAPSSVEVSIPDRVFTPRDVTIAVGGTVTWRNRDGAHTVTGHDGGFDSGVFEDGQSFSETFTSPGSFAYLCRLHPEMTGTVSVVGSKGATPATDADQSAPPPPPESGSPQVLAPRAPGPSSSAPATGDAVTGSAGEVTVAIADFAFAPRDLTVPAGSTVQWVNDGLAPHTVTSTTSGPLDSGMMEPGASYRQRVADPGVYEYLCTLHPEMTGRIEVTDASTEPPDATSSPSRAPGQTTESDRASESASDDGHRVLAADEAFDPDRLEVELGTSITWEMADDQPHTVTGDEFDSGILEPGETFTTTFQEAGTYTYACLVHPGMEGEVVVGATGGDSTRAASAPAAGSGPPPTRPARDESSGLPFAATVLLLGMVAAFATGRVTAPGRAT